MQRKGSSPRPLDLFEYTRTIPTPLSEPASVRALEFADWSDAQLARHLSDLLSEVQRRLETGRGNRPELGAAVKQARGSLERLVPDPARRGRPSRAGKTSSQLQEG